MVWLVMWDHFPREFFKYIAILAAIGMLGAFLAWAIRSSARPSKATMLKRHREVYLNHRCPVCAFRQAVWTKQGLRLQGEVLGQAESSRHTCPPVAMRSLINAATAAKFTQTLIPFCCSCGKEIDSENESLAAQI